MPNLAHRTRTPVPLAGRVDAAPWSIAPWSPRFVDMVDASPAWWDTRAAVLWNDDGLFVALKAEEPFVDARVTTRDEPVFVENDLEVFIDGGDCYYEFEINAAGTLYEVFFVWADAIDKPALRRPEFDLLARRPLTFAGDFDRSGPSFWKGTHPRGVRYAFRDWDFPGLRVGVHVDGTLNNHADVDKGWSVTAFFPWSGFGPLANGRPIPPRDGDTWRMFFGRFQKLSALGKEIHPHPAWVWSPHGVHDTHMPEKWTEITFTTQHVEDRANP